MIGERAVDVELLYSWNFKVEAVPVEDQLAPARAVVMA
jgi:hypothetical protein